MHHQKVHNNTKKIIIIEFTHSNVHIHVVRFLTMCVYTGEADLVLHHLKKLDKAGVSLKFTAVITPYNLQVCNNHCQTIV